MPLDIGSINSVQLQQHDYYLIVLIVAPSGKWDAYNCYVYTSAIYIDHAAVFGNTRPAICTRRHKRRAEETNFRLDLLCEIVMQPRFEDNAEAMLMRVKAAVAAPPPPPPRPRTEERVKQRKQIIFM